MAKNISDELLNRLSIVLGEDIEHQIHSLYQVGLKKTVIKRKNRAERYHINEKILDNAERVIIIIEEDMVCFDIDADTYRKMPIRNIINGEIYHSIVKKGMNNWFHTKNVPLNNYIVSLV